ncbi:type II toxin-antitoxin system ParD family antitoxin [Jannaschia sp. Os4]|uniref:type II toxin-antitoxin system ParD family antitoxin n=1 Tax=Jannaschia sp. Os4 TaxID=2807617 RepID=UPI00193A7496|nr:type II toxin-antitoxin system ParD family antitoxin [Jannaschia sp. Os4]MBM2575204.1 type II toxin-antitoxin system ParD family antitoxin [Jannaschia sp. Os4]
MATMNISLPDSLKAFVEEQAASGHYAGTSDYVRDLIRQDAERRRALDELRSEIQKGLDSGVAEDFDMETFLAERRAERARRRA